MEQPDAISSRRMGRSKTLAITAFASATALALTLPTVAHADPVPPPPPPPGTTAPDPNAPPAPPAGPNAAPPPPADPNAAPAPPADPNAAPPPPADPNAPPPPPPADPNAPAPPPAGAANAPAPTEAGRVNNAAGGFSYMVPGGWQVSDATQLSYGQALLTKIPPEGAPEPPNDTSILLGRLDLKLFAGSESDNTKAADRLASDMGEFFMPFPGTRVNQETVQLNAGGMPGVASYYEVEFTDENKPNGQIWAGVVGESTEPGTPRGERAPERWFVVWLGSANNPVDKEAAVTLANSIQQWTPPVDPNAPPADPNAPPADPNAPPPPPADPNAPPPPPGPANAAAPADPNAPGAAPRPGVGVPVPVNDAPPEMMPPA